MVLPAALPSPSPFAGVRPALCSEALPARSCFHLTVHSTSPVRFSYFQFCLASANQHGLRGPGPGNTRMPSGVHVEKQRWVQEAQNSQAGQGGDSEGSGPHAVCVAAAMRRLGTPLPSAGSVCMARGMASLLGGAGGAQGPEDCGLCRFPSFWQNVGGAVRACSHQGWGRLSPLPCFRMVGAVGFDQLTPTGRSLLHPSFCSQPGWPPHPLSSQENTMLMVFPVAGASG